jgi:hypothetical protein
MVPTRTQARLELNRQRMRDAGVDPDTGLPLDPRAVTFENLRCAYTGPACSCFGGLSPGRHKAFFGFAAVWWRCLHTPACWFAGA